MFYHFRLYGDNQFVKTAHGLLLQNLCISDCLMGLYISIVTIADRMFKDRYLWNYRHWQSSGLCKVKSLFVSL